MWQTIFVAEIVQGTCCSLIKVRILKSVQMDIQSHIRDVLSENAEEQGRQAEIREEDVLEALKDKGENINILKH